jgi:hypothetical protein
MMNETVGYYYSTSDNTCDHCWHDTGIMLMNDPPWYEQVCCYCGERRYEARGYYSIENHGPFNPNKRR